MALAGPPLTVITLSSNGAVKLQWGEVSREFLPGIIRDYRIEYRAANSSSVPLVNVVPPFLREYRLKGSVFEKKLAVGLDVCQQKS